MAIQPRRFSSRVDSELLAALRELTRREGRSFNAVLEDAMRDYITARREQNPRPSVMAHCQTSVEKHHRLSELLARDRPSALDEWWPVHPTARLQEGVSLRREDIYEERV